MNNKVYKLFFKRNRTNLFLFLMGIITGTLLFLILLIFEDSYIENVRESQSRCGRYSFMVDTTDDKLIDRIKNNKYVEDAYSIKCIEEKSDDDKFYSNYFGDETILDICGIVITKGEFPKNEKEILIDEDALTYLGFDDKEIGDCIEWEVNGEKKDYIISGYGKKTLFFNEINNVSEFKMVFFEKNPEANSTYFTINRYNDLFNVIKNIQLEMDIDVYANNALLGELGFFNKASLYEQNMIIYRYIFSIFVICNIFLVINIIKVFLVREFETLAIVNLIGIKKRKIISGMIGSILLVTLGGILIGLVNAMLIHIGLSRVIYHSFEWAVIVLKNIDYGVLLWSIGIMLLIIVISLIPMMTKIMVMSPNALFQDRNIIKKININKRKSIYGKRGSFERKIAINKLNLDKISKIVSIMGCCMGSCILIVGLYYLTINYSGKKGNFNNEYEIVLRDILKEEVIDEYDAKLSDNMGFSDNVKLQGIFFTTTDAMIKKDCLDDRYKEYLSQDVEKELALENGEDTYETYIKVYAYNDNTLKDICEKNGIKDWKLEKGQAYTTSNIFSAENNFAEFDNGIKKGDVLSIFSGEDYDVENKFIIKESLVNLGIYSGDENYDIIVVISEEEYKRLFGLKIPDYVYIKDKVDYSDVINSSAMNKLEHDRNIRINHPKQKRLEEIELNRILKVFVIIISLMAFLMAMIIILSSTLVRITTNIKEYAMMKAIGVSDKSINKMFIYENIHIFIWSQLLSFIVAYIATKGLLLKKYVENGTYLYRYPVKIVLLSILITGAIWSLSLIPILSRVRKINITDELKQLN